MSFRDAFREFPTLQTPRLILRQPRNDDAVAWYDGLRNPEVSQYYGNPDSIERRSLKSVEMAIGLAATHFARKGMIVWGLCQPNNEAELIGRIALQEFQNQSIAELGYWLARPHWNLGYMSEALRAVSHFAYSDLGLHRLWAGTDPRNLASCQMLERNGFEREGVLRASTLRDDGWSDTAIYAKLKSDAD